MNEKVIIGMVHLKALPASPNNMCSIEEMVVVTICGADFIRAELFVEIRAMTLGFLHPMAARLTRKKKEMNLSVKIFADVNVKESRTVIPQDIEVSIDEALKAGANAIIVTGLETGKPPSASEVKELKKLVKDTPLLIGSGVNNQNIKELMKYADGAIVGSSIKEDGKIDYAVSVEKTVKLLEQLK
ncbi:tryptophan synthase subunit alpha [Jeotgalibaca sp. MA1X17-3]|uniref:BtpA/SgcQ family protein n=1 Tax=Jeotgalibaca sp. MA1X17-3 TaxID=2908211 RepID=UPI001F3DDD29|nr:BtpA/SgcQ family protein [Jeotgalibaca sp. MA1X17-3]UJF15271.1 tryptophan synthase subunit alpha [Jeotgalibaca sp. MA1X17-3]